MHVFGTKKRVAVVAAAAAITLGATGIAYAYFSGGATGTGSATVGSPTALTITQVGSVSGLLPGAAADPVEYSVTNTGSGTEYVGAVTVAIATVVETPAAIAAWGDGSTPGTSGSYVCSVADFTLVQPTETPGTLAAAASYNSTTGLAGMSGGSIALKNLATNQNACIGATVNLTFTAA